MLFNSYIFIFLFFPILLLGYYGLSALKKDTWVLPFLCLMSFWFYGYSNIYYLLLLLGSIGINYVLSLMLDRETRLRKLFLILGILWNLGALFFFKYFNFFLDNFNHIFKTQYSFLRVALPLGISFFTFQQLSYIVDVYKKECKPYALVEYAAYVSYFPQLIAGPIVFHTELIPQFRDKEKRKFCSENFAKGMYAFACGLGKKVLIADTFSKIVTIGYADIDALNSLSACLVALAFTFQIYFDFSGYSDMAYGLALMCNIELPVNFNSPFKSKNVKEMWNRWHITLNRFFTKYLYIPLGGSRKGLFRICVNTLLVFTISGFWHGANWTFLVWGALHGASVTLYRLCQDKLSWIPKWIDQAYTFVLFAVAMVYFRADTVGQANQLLKQLFIGGKGGVNPAFTESFNNMIEMKALYRTPIRLLIDQMPGLFLLLFTGIVLYACLSWKNTQEKVADMKFSMRETLVVIGLLVWSIMSLSEISEFLYYNF